MNARFLAARVFLGLLAATLSAGSSATWAQTSGGTSSTSSGGQTGLAGVGIDASRLVKFFVDENGVAQRVAVADPRGMLSLAKLNAAKGNLHPKLGKKSSLRKISLNRLEQAVEAIVAGGGKLPDEMRYLAGLSRIQYVFFYPDSGDIVLAGPAEGWFEDLTGRTVGVDSGRPSLLLEDLVVALRAYGPGKGEGPMIGCSIDPTQEGLAKMQEFLNKIGPNATPGDTQFIVDGLRTSLGLQKVRVLGVSPNTHFAQVMVEADYRMKLIGIGLERTGIRQFVSYVDKADPATANRSALQRWYFVPNYECVKVSEDHEAMEMVGDGVKLVGENEFVASSGQRSKGGSGNRASTAFTSSFTKYYPELARRSPVYAQLRDLIDMAVAAAFIQHEGYYAKSGWDMPLFGDESRFPVEVYNAPVQVDTVVTSIWKGNRLMTPVGGGVHVEAELALKSENLLTDTEGKVEEVRKATQLDHLQPGQWWWD